MVLRRKASIIVPVHIDGIVGTTLVDTPYLATLDMQREHVGIVEMREESLVRMPRAVGIADRHTTRGRLQGGANICNSRCQCLDEIENNCRAATQKQIDLFRMRHDRLITLAGLSDASMLGQVQILTVQNDFHGTVRPKLGHIQKPVELGPGKNMLKLFPCPGDMHGPLFEYRAKEFLRRNRRDDLAESRF